MELHAMPVEDHRVSVIIPAYNACETIGETLSSVSAQSHANLEVIVVDDGSTDATAEIVRRHMAQDARIRLLQQHNAGVAQARNHAIAVATGTYLAPVDADDLWRPNKISSQLDAMLSRSTPGYSLVYTWYAVIDERSMIGQIVRPSYSGDVLPRLFEGNFVGHASSPLMRTEDVVRIGGYDATLRDRAAQGCEDWKLYLKLGEIGPFAVVEAPLTGYRVRPHSMSGDIGQMLRSHKLVMSEYLPGYVDHRRILRAGEQSITKYYLRKALTSRNYDVVSAELLSIFRRDPALGLNLLQAFLRRLRSARFGRNRLDQTRDDKPEAVHFLSSSFPFDDAVQDRIGVAD